MELDIHADGDLDQMQGRMEKIQRALPNIARLLAAEANIDLAQFGPGEIMGFMDRISPTEPAVPDQTDRPRW